MGEVIVFPIKQVLESRLINYSTNKNYIRGCIEIGVSYYAPPEKVREVLKDILSSFSEVLKEPAPDIRATSYGDFSIDYEVLFAIKDFGRRWEIKNAINFSFL